MSAIDFEPTDVKDLTMPERTVIEGANVIDYDVEYGVLPVDPDQLAAPTHNVAVPAEGTLGPYQTDGEGESDIWKVIDVTVKAGGKGYVKDATVKVPGKYPSDVPAVIKIDSLTDASHYELPSVTLINGGAYFQVGETITLNLGSEGDTNPVVTVTAIKQDEYYQISEVTVGGVVDGVQSPVVAVFIKGPATGDEDAELTCELENGSIKSADVYGKGKFSTDPSTWETIVYEVYNDEQQQVEADLDIVIDSTDHITGIIDTIALTNKGYFASSTSAGLFGNTPGSLHGVGASISYPASVEVSDGVIGSVSIVSEGSYARELDGDIDVVAGNGTGGKITVDMEMEEPESGEESGSEE